MMKHEAVREICGQKYDFKFKLMWKLCVLTEVPFTVRLVVMLMRRWCHTSSSRLQRQRKSEPLIVPLGPR